MKTLLNLFILLTLSSITSCSSDKTNNYTQYADPFIGTDGQLSLN